VHTFLSLLESFSSFFFLSSLSFFLSTGTFSLVFLSSLSFFFLSADLLFDLSSFLAAAAAAAEEAADLSFALSLAFLSFLSLVVDLAAFFLGFSSLSSSDSMGSEPSSN